MLINVIQVNNDADFASVCAIRQAVFIEEQSCPPEEEWDEMDATSVHVLAAVGGKPAGCGRVYFTGGTAIMGRIATLAEFRKTGVARAVCVYIEGIAQTHGAEKIEIHAQTHAAGFYEKLGYVPRGERFMEAGIEHIGMEKRIYLK